jgi:soluble lytic murein transglycosylase-like protein
MAATVWGASPEAVPSHLTSVVRSDTRSGKLVHSLVVSSRTVNATVVAPRAISAVTPGADSQAEPPAGMDELIERIAAEHSLPPLLIHAVIKVESNYNTTAISPKGALGLMQLIPSTARRFGVAHVFDPVENIQGGARYLEYLLGLYEHSENQYPLALAAYNAGEAAVAKYNGIPPYAETQNYVVSVFNHFKKLTAAAQAKPAPEPVVATAPAAPAGPSHVKEVVDPDGTVRYVSR